VALSFKPAASEPTYALLSSLRTPGRVKPIPLRQAKASLNAAWDRMKSTLTREYPDLKNPNSIMFKLYQFNLQNMRDQQNPILNHPLAPQLIADDAAKQLGITPLP
jgi:hypothetical protein